MARLGAGACAARPLESPGARRGPQHPGLPQVRQSDIGPWLVRSCAFSNCHSSPQADFFLTCGETDEQRDANFLRAGSFVALGSARVERVRAAAAAAGAQGRAALGHTGGAFFNTREDGRLAAAARLGRAVPPEPAPRTDAVSGRDVLHRERDAGDGAARLRPGGLPQPQRLQRLPPAPGHRRGSSRRWPCTATTRPPCTSSCRWTRPTCGSRAW